jgi:hypothetical protein
LVNLWTSKRPLKASVVAAVVVVVVVVVGPLMA